MIDKERQLEKARQIRYNIQKYGKTFFFLLLTISIYFASSNLAPPKIVLVKNILENFIYIEALLPMIIGLFYIFSHFYFGSREKVFSVFSLINGMLVILFGIELVVYCTKEFGDQLFLFASNHPQSAIASSITGVLVLIVVNMWKFGKAEDTDIDYEKLNNTISGNANRLSNKDAQISAAHEIGHLMIYATLSKLPDLTVEIGKDLTRGRAGFVNSDLVLLKTESTTQWDMLVCLAGKAGEKFLHGEVSLGSIGDYKSWEDSAKRFLHTHANGMYFATPENDKEIEWNTKKLEELEKNQLEILDNFFQLNTIQFKNLYNLLLDKKKLTKKEVEIYLSKVTKVEGIPTLDDNLFT